MNDVKTQRKVPSTLNFEKIDIFLRVIGRLPNKQGDRLTQEILDEFCRKYEIGNLTEGVVPLEYMYNLIKEEIIKPRPAERKDEG